MRKLGRREGLIALNGVLLIVLAGLVLGPEPEPAAGQEAIRARGSYTMVGGDTRSGTGNAVYILDAANQELIGVRWNETSRSLDRLGYRNMLEDANRPRSTGPR